jgi:hypothetical protein
MNFSGSSFEPEDLLEPLAHVTSVSAHQSAGSYGGFVATDDPDYLVTAPFEKCVHSLQF